MIKISPQKRGKHTRLRVWAGLDNEHLALCGTLIMHDHEWFELVSHLKDSEDIVIEKERTPCQEVE